MTTNPTDRELLTRFHSTKDREAFRAIVQRYGQIVFGVCRRVLVDTQHAEDAFQQTFLSLARQAATIRQPEALPGWLYRTARRAALATISKNHMEPLIVEPATRGRDPLDELTGRELIHTIEEEIARLPDNYRSAILLCGIDGLSVDEAAQQLDSTSGAVRGWLQRGREMLKQQLRQRGLELPAALTVIFGVPVSASAATIEQTIETACVVTLGKPLVFGKIGLLFLLLFVTVGGVIAWKQYHKPVPNPVPLLDLPAWELSVNASLPKAAIARLGDVRHTLQLGTKLIRFTRDGKHVLGVGERELVAWELKTATLLHMTPIENTACDLSPDGRWFAQRGKIMDALTGKPYYEAFVDLEPVAVHFQRDAHVVMIMPHPDGKQLTIRQIDVVAKKMVTLTVPGGKAKVIPGGNLVAVWDRFNEPNDGIWLNDPTPGSIRIHDVQEPNAKPLTLTGFNGEPLAVETDANGKRLFAINTDGFLRCWDTTTGARQLNVGTVLPPALNIRTMPHGEERRAIRPEHLDPLTISPDGDKALLRNWEVSGPVRLDCFSVAKQQRLWSVLPPIATRYASYLFDDEHQRLIINDSKMEVRHANTGELLSPETSRYAIRGPVYFSHTMGLSPDGRLIAFSSNVVGLYDVEQLLNPHAKPEKTDNWHTDIVNAVGFMPQSEDRLWSTAINIRVHDLTKNTVTHQTDYLTMFDGVTNANPDVPEWSAIDHSNKQWLTISWNGNAFVTTQFPIAKGLIEVLPVPWVRGLQAIHQEAFYTARLDDGDHPRIVVTRWNPRTGLAVWKRDIVADIHFIPSSKLNVEGAVIRQEYRPQRLLFTPDQKFLCVVCHTRILLLELTTGKIFHRFLSGYTKLNRVTFDSGTISGDGRYLATTAYNAETGQRELWVYSLANLAADPQTIPLGKPTSIHIPAPNVGLAMNHDGTMISVGESHHGIRVFDRVTGKLRQTLPQAHFGGPTCFSPSGNRLAVGEVNGQTAIIWNLSE